MADFARIQSQIWAEPITDNEISIMESVLAKGSETQVRKWLAHCVKVLKAQRENNG